MINIRQGKAVDLIACAALRAAYSTRTIWKFVLDGDTVRSGKSTTHTEDTVPDIPLLSFHVQRVRLPRSRIIALPSARVPLSDVWHRCDIHLVATDTEHDDTAQALPDDQHKATNPPPGLFAPTLMGYLLARILADQNQGMIERLLVDSAARRHGVGTALLRAAREWAGEQGLTALLAHAPLRNVPGIAFYQQCGFRICGLIERYYITNEDALLLTRKV